MKENTSGRPWLISTVNMNAPTIMLCFSITKNLDSIPRICSVRPGSLLREWIATLSRVGGLGRGDGAAVYFPVTMRTRQKTLLFNACQFCCGYIPKGEVDFSSLLHTLSILGPWILFHMQRRADER